MADGTERPQPLPLWPWLVAPALMLLLIVGFSGACVLVVKRGTNKADPRPEPEGVAASVPQPDPPPSSPTGAEEGRPVARAADVTKVDPPPTRSANPPRVVAPLLPARRPQAPPDVEPAASPVVVELPRLSEALRLIPPGEAAPREVPRPTREREALYDAVVRRFILYDVGRLQGLDGHKAALDFEALGPDAIPALVRGVNQSATLDASCPVSSISRKLGTLLASCADRELLARARDDIGKGVGPTPYHAYLTGLKRACEQRLKPRLPPLVTALKSKDPAARRKAANTLGLAGAEAKAAVPALVEALKDADAEVRGYAARALAAIGAPAVAALLKAAQSSPDPQVRTLACLALGESRPATDATTRALVAARADSSQDVRAAATSALARRSPAGAE